VHIHAERLAAHLLLLFLSVKEIHEELHYSRPPAEVFALISTGAFQLDLIAHLGGRDAEVVEEANGPDGGLRLVTRQQTAVDLPGFAQKIIPAHTTVTQTYEWGAAAEDGTRRGRWSAEAKGAPVSIGGPTELGREGDGTCHLYLGQVKASVPLVGGRLEGFALENLRKDLARANEFTASRL
jgi:hypothetical protein